MLLFSLSFVTPSRKARLRKSVIQKTQKNICPQILKEHFKIKKTSLGTAFLKLKVNFNFSSFL